MFIATMFSYGRDPECVGVDGIVTCMGVFLAYKKEMLYAIHLPAQATEVNAMGRNAFVTYVKKKNRDYRGEEAELFCVTNNDLRPTARDEMFAFCKDLSVGAAQLVRLRSNLGDQKKPVSAAVVCEFNRYGRCVLKYRKHADAGWQVGPGVKRAGYYKTDSMDDVLSAPSLAVEHGWHLVSITNSDILNIEF